jgi:hypothetical protein
MDSTHLNIIGLFLDIIGVLLIYFFGLPSNFNKGDVRITEGEISSIDKLKNKRIIKKSRIGIILIAIGFSLQFISNLISISFPKP